MILLSIAAPVLLVLAMTSASGNVWFWVLLFFIDLPGALLLGIIDWAERTRA